MIIIDFQELTHVHLIHVRIMEYVRQFKVLAPSSNVNVTAASLELLVIYVSQHHQQTDRENPLFFREFEHAQKYVKDSKSAAT